MVEQNARSRYAMATLVVARDWGDLFLQSSNAIVGHRLFERFDASRPGDPPRVLDQHNRTRMVVSAKPLSRPFHAGLGWGVGRSAGRRVGQEGGSRVRGREGSYL